MVHKSHRIFLPFLVTYGDSLTTGKSGSDHDGKPLPLKLMVVILPRNRVFGAHAHPTMELELTLRGALREVRLVTNGTPVDDNLWKIPFRITV